MTTEEEIKNALVPQRTKSYTPITHSSIITTIEDMCEENDLQIIDRSYQTNNNYSQVTGKFTLSLKDDIMGCMVGFQNSYDKTLSVKAVAGASIFCCSNGMMLGDSTMMRKHTGDSDFELVAFVTNSINNAVTDFEKTIVMRDNMKRITLTDHSLNALVGDLFLKDEVLRTEQLTLIRQEFKNPTYDYGVDKHNLWNVYNLFTDSIERKSHPSLYFKQHQDVVNHISEKYAI